MMSEIACSQNKVKYDVFITAAACSYHGSQLAVGTSDNLILLYQIGKRPFGDVKEDDQEEEDERMCYFIVLFTLIIHFDNSL